MKVDFGRTKFADKRSGAHTRVLLDTRQTINGHILIAGGSGTGKTHQLRRIISEMSKQDPELRFHVLDVHGDIEIPGSSSCKFSEASAYGVNPLKIDADPDMGGVRKRARSFIGSLNRTSRALGSKQESTLYNLLVDLYESHGFKLNRPESWTLGTRPYSKTGTVKRQPTIADLRAFAERRLKLLAIGTDGTALTKLEELNRKIRSLQRKLAKEAPGEELVKLKAVCVDRYREYLDSIEDGRELDRWIRYSGRDVLQSVVERISNLENAGVFRPCRPDFARSSPVWRYDLAALSRDEQILFVEFVAQELFAAARRQGHSDSPRHFVVLDEAHAFVASEADHILNVIVREARKFGLGLIMASQSLGDFPEDIIANTATKVILGVDEMFHQPTARKLAIDPKRLSWIVPRRTALVQIKRSGDYSNRYVEVELP